MVNQEILENIKYRMRMVKKSVWLEEKALQHPDELPVSNNVLTMFLGGYYAPHTPKGQQIIRWLREDGYLDVDLSDSHVRSLAA